MIDYKEKDGVIPGMTLRATGFRGEGWPDLTLNETYEVVQVHDGIFGTRPLVSVIGNLGKPTGLWHLSRFSFLEDA